VTIKYLRKKLIALLNKYMDMLSDSVGWIKRIEYENLFKKLTPIMLILQLSPLQKQITIDEIVGNIEIHGFVETSASVDNTCRTGKIEE